MKTLLYFGSVINWYAVTSHTDTLSIVSTLSNKLLIVSFCKLLKSIYILLFYNTEKIHENRNRENIFRLITRGCDNIEVPEEAWTFLLSYYEWQSTHPLFFPESTVDRGMYFSPLPPPLVLFLIPPPLHPRFFAALCRQTLHRFLPLLYHPPTSPLLNQWLSTPLVQGDEELWTLARSMRVHSTTTNRKRKVRENTDFCSRERLSVIDNTWYECTLWVRGDFSVAKQSLSCSYDHRERKLRTGDGGESERGGRNEEKNKRAIDSKETMVNQVAVVANDFYEIFDVVSLHTVDKNLHSEYVWLANNFFFFVDKYLSLYLLNFSY